MAYVLVGSRYIGTGALPAPVAGYEAYDTVTGNIYNSNTSATAWVIAGNANTANLGHVPTTGATMTGALTGATGFAPLDSPDFTTAAKKMGIDLATVVDLATTEANILDGIAPKITEAVASTSASISTKSNMAIGMGVLSFAAGGASAPPAQTIPLPTYPDGTTAAESDCKWIVSCINDQFSVGAAGPDNEGLFFSSDPSTTRTFSAYTLNLYNNFHGAVKIMYLIIGVRS